MLTVAEQELRIVAILVPATLALYQKVKLEFVRLWTIYIRHYLGIEGVRLLSHSYEPFRAAV